MERLNFASAGAIRKHGQTVKQRCDQMVRERQDAAWTVFSGHRGMVLAALRSIHLDEQQAEAHETIRDLIRAVAILQRD